MTVLNQNQLKSLTFYFAAAILKTSQRLSLSGLT